MAGSGCTTRTYRGRRHKICVVMRCRACMAAGESLHRGWNADVKVVEAPMALHRLLALVLMLFVLLPLDASAQTAPSAQAPSAAPSSDQLLKPEELDALVAPIALYPDSLLS